MNKIKKRKKLSEITGTTVNCMVLVQKVQIK